MDETIDGKGQGKKLDKFAKKKDRTEVLTSAPRKLEFAVLADKFIDAFDPKLTTPQIIEGMQKGGFSTALVEDLGESFSNFIEDARAKLALADLKDQELSELLRNRVSTAMIAYFQSQMPKIERFYQVSQNPAGYLQTVTALLSDESQVNKLSYADLNSTLLNMARFSERMPLLFLEIIAIRIVKDSITKVSGYKTSENAEGIAHHAYKITRSTFDYSTHSVNVWVEIPSTVDAGYDALGRELKSICKEYFPALIANTRVINAMRGESSYEFVYSLPEELRKKPGFRT